MVDSPLCGFNRNTVQNELSIFRRKSIYCSKGEDKYRMIKIFKWLFVESSARWLIYILTAEYFIATNLSPTILTDYPTLNYLVESMAFIPAVHNFDKVAVHPEVVRFYIVLAILLVIPKSFAVYDWLKNNPNMWMRQFIITPLTTTAPASSQLATRLSKSEEEIEKLPTVPRSRASAIFWSLMILLFTISTMIVTWSEGGFGRDSFYVNMLNARIIQGGISMWFELSVKNMTFTGLLLAISFVIIRDYITYFKALFGR